MRSARELQTYEENNYKYAAEFTECRELDYKDNYGNKLYTGAVCASSCF